MNIPADDCIAVVIPVRDEARTVADALESLMAQTVGPEVLELLIYDGQSSDATRRIAESFRQRAPWRRFEVVTNALETVPHALNAGLAVTTARWFDTGRRPCAAVGPDWDAAWRTRGAGSAQCGRRPLRAHAEGPAQRPSRPP